MVEKLVKWIVFSVFIGLLPFFWNALRLLTQGESLSLPILFARGEILLTGAALVAGALGDLLASQREVDTWDRVLYLICVGGCMILLMTTSFWFADISGYLLSGQSYEAELVAVGSPVLFGLCLAVSLRCLLLAD